MSCPRLFKTMARSGGPLSLVSQPLLILRWGKEEEKRRRTKGAGGAGGRVEGAEGGKGGEEGAGGN